MQELEYNYQSKFQLVTEPIQCLPHKCAACSRESSFKPNEPLQFVDWNLEVEFFGKIFICTDCLREMCNQMGYASPQQVIRLESQRNVFADWYNNLKKENEELRNALGSLGVVFDNPIPELPDLVSIEEPDEDDEVRVGDQDDITLGSTEGETGSTEQTPESGSTDVHSNESADELSDLI